MSYQNRWYQYIRILCSRHRLSLYTSTYIFQRTKNFHKLFLTKPSVIHRGHAPTFHRVEFQLVVTPIRADHDYSILFRRRKRCFAKPERILRKLARSIVGLSVISSRGVAVSVHSKLRERPFRL